MNAPENFDALLAASREQFPASRKVFVAGSLPGVRVPMREIISHFVPIWNEV